MDLLSAHDLMFMKQNYFDKAIEFGSLYRALKKSCRSVRWKDSVVGYENNGLQNTLELASKLISGLYKISKYQIFKIFEPKERVIAASRLVDRQFQRSLCDNGLYEDFTEHFIRDNVACQKGKGTDDAIQRMKIHLMRFYRKHGLDGWVLKCDVHHFFPETRHDVAKDAVDRYISDEDAANAVYKLIDSFDGDKGIGLGSQVSQLIELSVLSDMDHFIKERLRIKGYIRYMDDFILIHEDKEYLKKCKMEISDYLKTKGLELNKKTSIYPLSQGVIFLKWRFVLTETGKVLLLPSKDKVATQKRRIRTLYKKEMEGKLDKGATWDSTQSFLANMKRGNTYHKQKYIKDYFKEVTGRDFNEGRIPKDET